MAVAAEATWKLASEAYPQAQELALQRTIAQLGKIAVHGERPLAHNPEEANETTLLHAAQAGAMGDKPSIRVIETCVETDLGERLYKVANISKVSLQFQGKHLQQEGRQLIRIHETTLTNTHLIPEMLRKTKQELQNAVLFEELKATGALDDNLAVVFSPSSTKMSAKDKRDYGFFLETESCSLQVLSVESGEAELQTAMLAGKASPSAERHDIATINKLMHSYGIRVSETDGTSLLQYVMLIPKSQAPNGIVDIVRAYDDAAGSTFFGEAKPRQDYLKYAEFCEQRHKSFDTTVQRITKQLLSEAHMFRTPLEAIERLDYLSERLGVEHAVHDSSIDAAVFGSVSARHIADARFFAERGEHERADQSMTLAKNTADSSSCPLFKGSSENQSADDSDGSKSNEESSGKKLMNCPFCKAKVFDDPCATVLSCWDCRATVINGRVTSKGDGGHKARKAARQQKRDERAKQAELRQNKEVESEMTQQVDDAFTGIDVTAIEAEERQRKVQPVAQLALKA